MKISKDYWPGSDEDRRAWLLHFKEKLPTYAAVIGVTPSEVAQFNSYCDATTGAIDNAVTKKNEYDSALADRETLVNTIMGFCRPLVRRIKTNAHYTPAIGEALDIDPESTPVDPTTVKPRLTATVHSGYVRLRIQRNGAQSVNLYSRLAGQAAWTFLCRVQRANCQDATPLAAPGVPEVREYQAIGVIDDAEVGIPSDPKVVVFAGHLAA